MCEGVGACVRGVEAGGGMCEGGGGVCEGVEACV